MQRKQMPNANRLPQAFAPAPAAVTAGINTLANTEDGYGGLQEESSVEMLSVPGFIRRVVKATGVNFHMEDINFFGAKVGACAEGMHLSYFIVTEKILGPIRAFPVGMMERVYAVLAEKKKWPLMLDGESGLPATEEGAAVVAKEKLARLLRGVLESAPTVELKGSTAEVIQFVESDAARLRAELEAGMGLATSEDPAPLPPKQVQGRVKSTKP